MLHVGALRDALFKYLMARREGGQNILRIEDTDRTRYSPDSEDEFIRTLEWVGIDFDEGPHVGGPHAPYRQSERKEAGIYAGYIAELMAKGHAYKAFDTADELAEMREMQKLNRQPEGYFGGQWRDASPEQVAAAEAEGRPYVIRQRIPRNETIAIQDLIRGRIEWDSNTIDDPVLIKSDGMPTYHFASMVDDHVMQITHIIRGEEWISSAPKHAVLFDQFGWERPIFVHCPVIVGNDGKKLSKRHGATRVLDYAAMGFLRVALKNFIALIGWSAGDDKEVYTDEELVQAFSIDRVQASPGKFDMEKFRWLNGHHIRMLTPEALLDELLAYIAHPYTKTYWLEYTEENPMPNKPPVVGADVWRRLERIPAAVQQDREYVLRAILLEQERVVTLADFGDALEFFLVDEPEMDPKAAAKWLGEAHVLALREAIADRVTDAPYEEAVAHYERVIRDFAAEHGMEKLGPVVHPTRVILTGRTFGPGLFELMAALGPERVRARMQRG